MSVVIANNAKSTLSAGIDENATQLSVQNGDGSLFPALSGDQWFPLTLVKVDSTFEIVKATARSSDSITIVRGQEGTAKLSFSAGDKVELRLTAAVIEEFSELKETVEDFGDIVSRNATVSESEPSGGSNGDLWFQYGDQI